MRSIESICTLISERSFVKFKNLEENLTGKIISNL